MLVYYKKEWKKQTKSWRPGVIACLLTQEKFYELTRSEEVKKLISDHREGVPNSKIQLPAAVWVGTQQRGGYRKAENMTPTGMFMVDLDHISEKCDLTPSEVWEEMQKRMRLITEKNGYVFKPLLAHITPSGDGLRAVLKCTENFPTLAEHMEWLRELLRLDDFCNWDGGVHDVSRISFLPQFEDILFIDNEIFNAPFEDFNPIVNGNVNGNGNKTTDGSDGHGYNKDNLDNPLNQREARLEPLNQRSDLNQKVFWLGHDVQEIIDRMFAKALPCKEKSNRHESSLKLASDLLVLLDGDKKTVEELLRRQSWVKEIIAERNEDVAGTVNSATQRKTKKEGESLWQGVSRKMNAALKALYGKTYYEIKKEEYADEIDEQEDVCEDGELQGEETEKVVRPVSSMPTPPPVIRELISIAPEDFVIPAINSLLPILGTLTSYVRTEDKSNAKTLSTSFFSIIYAPPSSGKSFVERYINLLLRDLFRRDEINDAKDAIYARAQQKKSANDRSEAVPQTSIRIMEAKNSEAEFLEKQRNNKGYHMFTYCSEIDQWRKGIRAAGGNKDDMVRIAWDNGKYGQNFKSSNTFKGKVALYWNVLIAGTSDQLMAYFKNVTNGLVTRCSFAEIENQQFQSKIPQWGKLSQKDMKVIDAFIEKCDEKTYQEPLNYNPEDCYSVSDEDYDKEVPWHFSFKPFEQVSIDWIMKTVERFNDAQCNRARIDSDEARDTFRRRVAERGKRLALLCTQLYQKTMTKQDKELCKKWIAWWMEQDIENILKPFGRKYIEAMQESTTSSYRGKTILERLGEEFSAGEVKRVIEILGYKYQARNVITRWVTAGVVEKFAQDRWRKVTNGANGANVANGAKQKGGKK